MNENTIPALTATKSHLGRRLNFLRGSAEPRRAASRRSDVSAEPRRACDNTAMTPAPSRLARTARAALVAGISAVIAVTGLVVAPAQQAAADVNVYTTPGEHVVNGRKWRTTCEPYTATIDRCRAEIWATQIAYTNGRYSQGNGWVFNNLTYLASPRAQWGNNPLANDGEWTSADGRRWKTSCGDSWTGPNGCRSFIQTNVVTSYLDGRGQRQYKNVPNQWVFNNLVAFTGPAKPGVTTPTKPAPTTPAKPTTPANCVTGIPLPAGYKLHNSVPVVSGSTRYQPQTVAEFGVAAMTDIRTSNAQKKCLADLVSKTLQGQSSTKNTAAGTARLFPNPFSARPNPSAATIGAGWVSASAQGKALEFYRLAHEVTGDAGFRSTGQQVANSYQLTISQGGFVNTGGGQVWFEKYPSLKSGDLVGHVDAAVPLRKWYLHTGDQQALAGFDKAVVSLEAHLDMFEVPTVSGGVTGAADLMRGYAPAPLRIVAAGSVAEVTSVTFAGKPVNVPLVTGVSDASGTPPYPLVVAAGQVQQLTVAGTGNFSLQAKLGGVWRNVSSFTVNQSSVVVDVPEHVTGRSSDAAVTAAVVSALRDMSFQSGHTVFSFYANHWK